MLGKLFLNYFWKSNNRDIIVLWCANSGSFCCSKKSTLSELWERKKLLRKIESPKQRFWVKSYRPFYSFFFLYLFNEELICFFVNSWSPSGWTGLFWGFFPFFQYKHFESPQSRTGSCLGPLRARSPVLDMFTFECVCIMLDTKRSFFPEFHKGELQTSLKEKIWLLLEVGRLKTGESVHPWCHSQAAAAGRLPLSELKVWTRHSGRRGVSDFLGCMHVSCPPDFHSVTDRYK